MTDLVYIILIAILILIIILFLFFRKSFSRENYNDINNDLVKELTKKMDNLHTKLEVEQTTILNNIEGSSNNLKDIMKLTAENTERTTNAIRVEAQKISNILQDNSKRGAWGEKIADDLLKNMGMIEGKSYQKQKKLPWISEDNKELKPDFTFNIDGDGKLFIMDSKFPLSNYNRMFDENGNPVSDIDIQKKAYIKEFRKRIDEVKKYINTSENTLDLAAMFIPVSTILDETLQMDSAIVDYAIENKVVLVSPANFYALISFLKYSETLFQVTREQQTIMKIFTSLKEQWMKYEASFEDVEKKLEKLSESIDSVKSTRTNAMSREIKKVDEILSMDSKKLND